MEQAGNVDPEIQASISNLVSALGGLDPATQEYKLGDEALACLRDLRKWLQNYDAKFDRLEVACAIANTSLVTYDIPQIIGLWELKLRKLNDPYLDRLALACLELLVPLTWPINLFGMEATAEKFIQSMFLKKAQIGYKKAIISHRSHGVLRALIRLAAPALRVTCKNREARDEGILTLVVSCYRNILSIDTGEDEDRGSTVKEFGRQKVLAFLVTVAAGMAPAFDMQFDAQDTLVMECLYLMLRGVDVGLVHGLDAHDGLAIDVFSQNLKQLLDMEAEMNRSAFRPSRHSRFGTLVAMDEGDGNRISISGQRGVCGSTDTTLIKLDESKRWHRPAVRGVADEHEKTSYMPSTAPINSDEEAMKVLRKFIADFLDASYNPLFVKIRKLIERQQSPRIATVPPLVHYCYLVGFFLNAERVRSQADATKVDYQLVGGSLSKSSLAIVLGLLRKGLEPGELRNTDLVHASMACFRQILISIRDLSYTSEDETMLEAAEGFKSRLFYEESWLNLLAQLPRTAHRKSLAYACETIAVTHIVLKMLDEYAKQHSIMFVRKRQRQARMKNKMRDHAETEEDPTNNADDIDAEREHREVIRVTNERKFSFDKFVLKYINSQTIDTYERVLASYKEVSEETILHIFSFFRRTFAKTKCRAVFYRMSLMRLLLMLIGHHGLPKQSKSFKVAEQFLRYYVQKFVETADHMPSLHIQINENITPADAFYYDHGGQDKEKFRPPKYEFELTSLARREFSPERQMAVIIAALIDIGKSPFVKWTEETLTGHLNKVSGAAEGALTTTTVKRQTLLTVDKDRIKAVHNDALLRLFLRTLGLIVNTTVGQIVIPSTLDELVLIEHLQWLSKYQNEPVNFEDGKVAMDYIKIAGDHDALESDGENHEEEQLWVNNNDDDDNNDDNGNDDYNEGEGSGSGSGESSIEHAHSQRQKQHKRKPQPSQVSSMSRKRAHYDAFALQPSDDDDDASNEALTQTIAAIRRRTTVDDDDED